MKIIRIISLLLALALAGCHAHPPQGLPADKAAYVGVWQSKTMYLRIGEDGSVSYHRSSDGSNVSINAPIESFDGNDFDVGVGPLKTTFHVSKPPYRENGQWKMVVDGTLLTKAPDAAAPATPPATSPPSPPAPAGGGVQV